VGLGKLCGVIEHKLVAMSGKIGLEYRVGGLRSGGICILLGLGEGRRVRRSGFRVEDRQREELHHRSNQ
jgi:hypothetical protein